MKRAAEVIGRVQGLGQTGADLVPLPTLPAPPARPSPLPAQVREYIRASKAKNTLRGYQSDWRAFCEWCEGQNVCPLPAAPDRVAAYIAECAGHLKPGRSEERRVTKEGGAGG